MVPETEEKITDRDHGPTFLLDRDDAAEIVPAEKHLDAAESCFLQELEVFLQTVGNEHVFECFALLGDLDIGVAVAALVVVVVLDEQAVEGRVLAGELFDKQ
ncbi:hypothetical protein D9M72_520640 [compost metagenome]